MTSCQGGPDSSEQVAGFNRNRWPDSLGICTEAASALFQVVSRRYLKGSIVLTTNRSITNWGEIFQDPMVAVAMLDRLLHRSAVLHMEGESYRMRAHRARVENLRKGVVAGT